MVCEEPSHSERKMTSAVFVEHAIGMARFLEDREFASVGDREMARAQLEFRYGIAGSILYALRYRPPKQIAADIYARLCAAVEDVAARQIKALEHDLATARARRLSSRKDALRQAAALLDEIRKELERGSFEGDEA